MIYVLLDLEYFGHKIAEQLLEDKTNNIRIALVDKDEKHLLPFKDEVNSIYILDAAEKKALEAINIADFDVVIIATSDNIEIAAALNEIGIKKIIARANSKRHANVLKQIGVNIIISPEEEAGQKTALLVANPSFILYSQMLVELQDGYVTGSVYIKNPELIGRQIKNLGLREKYNVSIVIVKRGTESFLPSGSFVLDNGDLITIVGTTENVTEAFSYCANEEQK